MVQTFKQHLSIISLFILVVGCGSTHPNLSDNYLKVIEFNQKAEYAFKKGEYINALNLYNESLKLSRSIENIDSISINMINMAIVCRKLGDKDKAHLYIDEVLNRSHNINTSTRYLEAAFIKAILYTDDGEYDTALNWINKTISFNKDEESYIKGRTYNLKAKIALLKGDEDLAIFCGTEGLKQNKEYNDQLEVANSLRLLAEANARSNAYEEAMNFYNDALLIDKTLGISKKIFIDLMGIGDTLFNQGMYEDATKYYQRALSVKEGEGDEHGIKYVSEMIEKCLSNLNKR